MRNDLPSATPSLTQSLVPARTSLFRVLLLLTVVIAWTSVKASDIVQVSPITPKILMLTFDDGHIDYFGAGEGVGDNKVYWNFLNVDSATNKQNYFITSTDDADYLQYQHPVYVGRKAKATDFHSQWPEGVYDGEYVKEHYVYILLPSPLKSGKTYTVNLNGLAQNKQEVTFTFDEKQMRSEAIHVSQVGFSLQAPKYAYFSQWMGDFNYDVHQNGGLEADDLVGQDFWLIKTSDQAVAFTGTIAKRRDKSEQETVSNEFGPEKNYTHANVYEMDFSSFQSAGEYKVVIPGIGSSYPFEIATDAYADAFHTAMQGLFFQRSGIYKEIEPGFVYPADHNPNNSSTQVYYQPTLVADVDFEKHFGNKDEKLPAGFQYDKPLPEAWGYYHDAGDWDGYANHARVPFSMMLLYDLQPAAFTDGQLSHKYKLQEGDAWSNEGANGVPDLLDEAGWLPNFYKRVNDALVARGYETGGVPDYVGREGADGGRSWADTRDWGASAVTSRGTYLYAGLAAYYAVILNKFWKTSHASDHPDFQMWVDEATDAWDWAQAHEAEFLTYTFPWKNKPITLVGNKMLAAASLYRATGQATYQAAFETEYNNDPTLSFGEWSAVNENQLAGSIYSQISPSTHPNLDMSFQSQVEDWLIGKADGIKVNAVSGNSYRVIIEEAQSFGLGTFSTPRVIVAAVAHQLTGDTKYLDAIHTTAHYTLGGNELNMAYLTGIGHQYDRVPFHPDSWALIDYNSMVYTNTVIPGYTSYFGDNITWVGGNGSELWSRSSAYPNISVWPESESRFENRGSINGSEFTIDQQNSQTAFAYGYLHAVAAGPTPFNPNARPTVSLNVEENVANFSTTTLTANASGDVYKVEYYYDWHYIGESKDASSNFAYDWKVRLATGQSYLITAVAVDSQGKMTKPSPGAEKTITVEASNDTEAPSAPDSLAASEVTNTSVKLSWIGSTDNNGVARYEIYNGTDSLTSANYLLSESVVADLVPGTTYDLKVRAVDFAGNASDFSNSVVITTLPDNENPSDPTNLRADGITNRTLVLQWNASEDNVKVDYYEVFRNGVSLGQTSELSFSATGLAPNTGYTFGVQAVDVSGNASALVTETFATNNLPTYKYLKITFIDKPANGIHLNEIEYLVGGTAYPEVSVNNSSTNNVIEGEAILFDKDPTTGKYTGESNLPKNYTLELEEGIYPYQLVIYKKNWVKLNRFTVEGSNDLTEWSTLGEFPENMTQENISSEQVLYYLDVPGPPKIVSIDQENQPVQVGSSVQLTTTILTDSISNTNVTWSSGAEGIATVDQNGLVSGVAEGRATIIVTTEEGEHQDSVSVLVTAYNPYASLVIADFDEIIPTINTEEEGRTQMYAVGNVTATDNPAPSANNASARVARFEKPTGTYKLIGFNLAYDTPIDFYETLSFQLYGSNLTSVYLSVNDSTGTKIIDTNVNVDINNQWGTVTVDVPRNTTRPVTNILIFPSPTNKDADTIYLDNVQFMREQAGASYTITASATDGGTISPSGQVAVNSGSDQSFAIVPNVGYAVEDVLVDGSSVGAVGSYTFTEVNSNHTITASFAAESGGYRYLRLSVTKSQGDRLRLTELDYIVNGVAHPQQSMTAPASPAPLVVTSSDGNDKWRGHWKLYDNELTAEAFNIKYTNGTTLYWNQLDLGEGNEVTPESIVLTAGSTGSKGPEEFIVEGSDDGSTWTELLNITGETDWTLYSTHTYPIVGASSQVETPIYQVGNCTLVSEDFSEYAAEIVAVNEVSYADFTRNNSSYVTGIATGIRTDGSAGAWEVHSDCSIKPLRKSGLTHRTSLLPDVKGVERDRGWHYEPLSISDDGQTIYALAINGAGYTHPRGWQVAAGTTVNVEFKLGSPFYGRIFGAQGSIDCNDLVVETFAGNYFVVQCDDPSNARFAKKDKKLAGLDSEIEQAIQVYPNPAESELSVILPASEAETVTLQLFSQTGVKVMEQIVSGKDLAKPATLDISNMSKAVYMLRVTDNHRTWNHRIIVR